MGARIEQRLTPAADIDERAVCGAETASGPRLKSKTTAQDLMRRRYFDISPLSALRIGIILSTV